MLGAGAAIFAVGVGLVTLDAFDAAAFLCEVAIGERGRDEGELGGLGFKGGVGGTVLFEEGVGNLAGLHAPKALAVPVRGGKDFDHAVLNGRLSAGGSSL